MLCDKAVSATAGFRIARPLTRLNSFDIKSNQSLQGLPFHLFTLNCFVIPSHPFSMAEIGLAASNVRLAGAATKLSLGLFSLAENIGHARLEATTIATEI
jgi:hypothetical protein